MAEETPPTAIPHAQGASAEPSTATRGVDVSRLTREAASKSGMLWIRVPEGGTHPVWHVWHDGDDTKDGDDSDDSDADVSNSGPAAYVVSGPGEQPLPWLPEEVGLVLRSKDTGGRLLTLRARAVELEPGSEEWTRAVEVLKPARLNATGDLEARWKDSCTVHAITPHGQPVEAPGEYEDADGAAPVRPAAPATARRRPWHWRGRAGARRNTTR